jgi:heme exporter protein CcmD
MNWHQIIVMGGYGIYVWPTYAITLSVFAMNVLMSFHEKKQIKKMINQYES